MKATWVVRVIERRGGRMIRQRGSHRVYLTAGGCRTVVPMHAEDIAAGTLRQIVKDLEPCLGKGWLTS